MKHYCYLIEYSFDDTRIIKGPKTSKEEMWAQMVADAKEEYRIDTEENQYKSVLTIDEENDIIVLVTPSTYIERGTITTWTLFEMED